MAGVRTYFRLMNIWHRASFTNQIYVRNFQYWPEVPSKYKLPYGQNFPLPVYKRKIPPFVREDIVDEEKVGLDVEGASETVIHGGKAVQKLQAVHLDWEPSDNVYVHEFYPENLYTVPSALKVLCKWADMQKTYENIQSLEVHITMTLDMVLKKSQKRTTYLSPFQNHAIVPHPFNRERRVLAFVKAEECEIAKEAGAVLFGGEELIKQVIDERVLPFQDFDIVVASINMKKEIASKKLLNALKTLFPKESKGNIGRDLNKMITKFRKGVWFGVPEDDHIQDQYQNQQEKKTKKAIRYLNTTAGLLNMNSKEIEANLLSLMAAVSGYKSSKSGEIIKEVSMEIPSLCLKLPLDINQYLEASTITK